MKKKTHSTPFGEYFRYLDKIDKNVRYTKEFGSMLILSLVEEIGEMSRAYLAKHGRKQTNIAAQKDKLITLAVCFLRTVGVAADA